MNKEDALRQLPSVCTTAETIAIDFMQVMHVHKWMSVETRVGCPVSAHEVCHDYQFPNQSNGPRHPTLIIVLG